MNEPNIPGIADPVRIDSIPLPLIDDFPDHPFRVRDDEDMTQLMDSVRELGVLTPAIVRPKDDGRYELVSGHRRKRACELAGIPKLPCQILTLSRDEAIILMVDSNVQRSRILPSEKAKAYKMRLDAMRRQGMRTDLTSCPVGTKLTPIRSDAELANDAADSARQIHRYIRLTNLVDELLELVDEGRIKMRPAVELSYLDEEAQRDLVDLIDTYDCTPSHAQAIRLRGLAAEGRLDYAATELILAEEKPNQRDRIVLRGDRIRELLPSSLPPDQTESYVCEALEFYGCHLRARNARDSR